MNPLLKIVRLTKNLWPYYAGVSILSIVVALLAQSIPVLTGAIVGELQQVESGGADVQLLWLYVALLFGQDFLTTLVTNVQGYYGDIFGVRLQQELSEKYYVQLMSLPQSYFDEELSGTITARLNRGIVQLSQFANTMANNFNSFLLTAIISLIIVAFISWPVALLLFILYPLFIYMTIKTSGKWMEYQGKKNEHQDIAFGRFQEVISQVKVVKSFVREKAEQNFFAKHMASLLSQTYPQSKLWHGRDIQRRTLLNIIMGAVYAVIVWQAVEQQISLVEAVMLIQFSALIRFPIFTISFLVDAMQRAVSDSKDYLKAMELEPAIVDQPNAKSLKVDKAAVRFEEVEFSYGNKKVLKGLDFQIRPGSKVALVGESGEGKSTISNLLLRLYTPESGRILIDDQDISHVTQASLRRSIGMVFQDSSLFSGTVRENICYGNPKVTKERVVAAAKAANAHEFISKFEEGYDTLIGERGLKLSGGQKQRLAIARAILKDAPILVLDEATSSLDNKSELLVQEALEHLMQGRTTIIIAHRLSTIQNVDTIVTLQNGRVNEIGSPRQLAKTGGIYDRLLEVQAATSATQRKKVLAKYGIVA